jgi:hypothetical protein
MVLVDPSHGAEESLLETFSLVDGAGMKDDLHRAEEVSKLMPKKVGEGLMIGRESELSESLAACFVWL